jgi:hypothetical protein
LTVALQAFTKRQAPPFLNFSGTSLEVGLLLNGGRVIGSGAATTPSLTAESGEFVTLNLSQDLHPLSVGRRALPPDDDIHYARCFAVINPEMDIIVAGKPHQKLVTLQEPSLAPRQLSSSVGLGSLFGVPNVQAIADDDSTTTIAWIDTDRQFDPSIAGSSISDPTANGGDIHARTVTRSGVIRTRSVPGFPVATRAQCFCMTRLDTNAVLVWAGIGTTGIRITTIQKVL